MPICRAFTGATGLEPCGVKKLGSGLQPLICSADAAGRRSWNLPSDPMRGWCGCGGRPTVALDAAPAVSAVVAAPACCRVRREHASDALAGGAAALASEGKRAAAHSRSTLAAAAKAAAAGQQ